MPTITNLHLMTPEQRAKALGEEEIKEEPKEFEKPKKEKKK